MAPRKRARAADGTFMPTSGGSITGGTGDIKPQILTRQTDLHAVDDYISIQIDVPRIIMNTANQATIMEILKVYFYIGIDDFADVSHTAWAFLNTTQLHVNALATSFAELQRDLVHPGTFAFAIRQRTLTTSGSQTLENPIVIDLTDNNGNGLLIASDRFFLTSADIAGTSTDRATVKILYRMVNVGILEYVGIVQSQI